KAKGVVVREPSVGAVNNESGDITAVTDDARDMLGRTPCNITVVRPMKDGVIADYDTTATVLRYYIKKARSKQSVFNTKPNIVVCVPSGITKVEERAVLDATRL